MPGEYVGHALRQVASGSCAMFDRRFEDMRAVVEAARSHDHWFSQLLSRWRVPGSSAGHDGLRLAVRNGYINFYHAGQSVARVTAKGGRLIGHVHEKYVLGPKAKPAQRYARICDNDVSTSEGRLRYEGFGTLDTWIRRIDGSDETRGYSGKEKRLVDQVVAANDTVIDLEMALPSWLLQPTAQRVDLVTVEDRQIVFWEVKLANDKRVRSALPFEAGLRPEVLQQLAGYRIFLEQDAHVDRIASAYKRAAGVLVQLAQLAALKLSSAIIDAATAEALSVARQVVLVVVGREAVGAASWQRWKSEHEPKLTGRIDMQVMEVATRLRRDP